MPHGLPGQQIIWLKIVLSVKRSNPHTPPLASLTKSAQINGQRISPHFATNIGPSVVVDVTLDPERSRIYIYTVRT